MVSFPIRCSLVAFGYNHCIIFSFTLLVVGMLSRSYHRSDGPSWFMAHERGPPLCYNGA
jgi:hypothetical protein